LLASVHAALETGSKIEVSIFVENGDDPLLLGVGDFHFARGCHAAIYVAWSDEPDYC
jgi:hypothetical protein